MAVAIHKCTKNWTCRDGSKVRICDMADSHLLNTIRMLRRVHEGELLLAYQVLSTLSGEMAQFSCEQDIAQMEDRQSLHPLYDDLVAEMERRGLTLEVGCR